MLTWCYRLQRQLLRGGINLAMVFVEEYLGWSAVRQDSTIVVINAVIQAVVTGDGSFGFEMIGHLETGVRRQCLGPSFRVGKGFGNEIEISGNESGEGTVNSSGRMVT